MAKGTCTEEGGGSMGELNLTLLATEDGSGFKSKETWFEQDRLAIAQEPGRFALFKG